VGHPLGYIASDVYARYKDIKVLMYCTDGLWQFWIAGWTIRHSNWTTSEDTTSVNIDGGFDKEG
jgi:hypothetical protein